MIVILGRLTAAEPEFIEVPLWNRGTPDEPSWPRVSVRPESKFYPGVNGPFQRHVCVYVPAQYVPGTAGRSSFRRMPMRYALPTILDNMIVDHRVPVMVAVVIANGGSERRMQ